MENELNEKENRMGLLTDEDQRLLLENGRKRKQLIVDGEEVKETYLDALQFMPVVKLFTPDANCIFLFSELDPGDPDFAFGLCDMGMGCPELGKIRISELESLRGARDLPVECDRDFQPQHKLMIYARAAQIAEGYTEDEKALAQAAAAFEKGEFAITDFVFVLD